MGFKIFFKLQVKLKDQCLDICEQYFKIPTIGKYYLK